MRRFALSGILLCLSLWGGVARAVTYGDYEIIRETMLKDQGGVEITNYGRGLAYDGTDLWYTAQGSPTTTSILFRINPETQTVTGSWPLPFQAHGIAWDGTYLQIVDNKPEPRVRAYDRQGVQVGTRLVDAQTERFEGIAWDGTRLWGSDDTLMLRFDADGEFSKVHVSSWHGIGSGITWDGTHLVAMVDHNGWTTAFSPYTIRIDPETGHVSDYRKVSTNSGGPDRHHIAIGNGRMWILHGAGLARLMEVVRPVPEPLSPMESNWGVFPVQGGFAVPHRNPSITGAALGAYGDFVWYGDYFGISKMQWNNPALNAGALDLTWPVPGGTGYDLTSDGTRVWMTNVDSAFPADIYRVIEMNMSGEIVRNFGVTLEGMDGLAWDGEALWVGATLNSPNLHHKVRRYSADGQLLAGPFLVGAEEHQFTLVDMTWHQGELWILSSNQTISRMDPATGKLIARHPTGELNSSHSGLASNGTHLFAVARPKRLAGLQGPPGSQFPMVLRLGLPVDLTPPHAAGATATTSQLVVRYNETMPNDHQTSKKANYALECPPGTPVDLSPAGVAMILNLPTGNQMTISGLSLPAGSDYRLTLRMVRDATGNLIREDGLSNVLTGTVGGLTAPAGVTAKELLFNEVTVGWRDASAGETSFRLERKVGEGEWLLVTEIASTTGAGYGAVLAHTDTAVSAGQVYSYRVRAQSAEGNSPFSNVAVASLMDADGDGWSDSYETSVTLTNPQRADTDADGARDPAEIVAGTNPLDAKSVFAVKAIERESDGRITLRWNGVAGKTYRVVRSGTPDFASLEVIAPSIPGVAPVTTFTTATPQPAGKGFYRVEVE